MLSMDDSKLRSMSLFVVSLLVMFAISFSQGYTDPRDVYAINTLYVTLGSPPLPGWRLGGDPCFDGWLGVQCVISNITAIILPGANLRGSLGDALGNFTSIITIDLSNNYIGGRIPENLPITMRRLILSANHFTGAIPSSLSNLALLSDLVVNNNFLVGPLPDAFQSLTGLINLDLSSNNLSGQLPPSMGNLSSLTTLHMQNNRLSGTLNVLQDLSLVDLNIENNLFSGPIPEKLFTIPNFRKAGNPFNTTIPPSQAPAPSPLDLLGAPAPSDGSSIQNDHHLRKKKKVSPEMVIAYAVAAGFLLLFSGLMAIVCIPKCRGKEKEHDKVLNMQKERGEERPTEIMSNTNMIRPNNNTQKKIDNSAKHKEHKINMTRTDVPVVPPLNEKVPTEKYQKKVREHESLKGRKDSTVLIGPEGNSAKHQENEINMTRTGALVMPPLAGKVTVPAKQIQPPPKELHPKTSVSSFSVASLQQYTNNFSEENLISNCKFGNIYMAELLDGKLLTVTKLDDVNSNIPVDQFLKLVSALSKLKHRNILEFVGYCADFEQRLLVYHYFSRRTLHDILHFGDDIRKKLSWNARVRIALGAAEALEYLHEGFQPPLIHQNFGSSNILLNDEFAVRVSECGLASLMLSGSATQLSDQTHALSNNEAPEINDISSTSKSDVYNFGIVMLELLTGREPYDSSRPREERHLVRWASAQLYDINALSRMVDPSIEGTLPMKSLSRFADIINRCIQQEPEFRPLMSEVVQDLTRVIEDAGRSANRTMDI